VHNTLFLVLLLKLVPLLPYNLAIALTLTLASDYGMVVPTLQIVYKGKKEVTIYCNSTSQVIWLNQYKQRIKSSVNINGNQLHIFDLKNRDTGLYTCVGTTPTSTFQAKSQLLVGG